jgi:hypothetical protein
LLEVIRFSVPEPDWIRDPLPEIWPPAVIALPDDSCMVRAAVLETAPRVMFPEAALMVWLLVVLRAIPIV